MIVILAPPSFQATLLEKQLIALKQHVERCDDIASAMALDPVMVMVEAGFCSPEDLQDSSVNVSVGEVQIDHPNIDSHLQYPVSKTDLETLLMEEDTMFDAQIQTQIVELLGAEKYGKSVSEVMIEVEELVQSFDKINTDEQISKIHKVSGACAMLGLKGLRAPLLKAELAGKRGDMKEFQELWRGFNADWPEMRSKVMERIAT